MYKRTRGLNMEPITGSKLIRVMYESEHNYLLIDVPFGSKIIASGDYDKIGRHYKDLHVSKLTKTPLGA